MNFEVPNLLLLTNGVDSREELINFLKSECGYVVDMMANASHDREQAVSPDQRYQVLLLDNLYLPGRADDSMESYLDFVHELKVRCPQTEVLFIPGQKGGNFPSSLRVGLLRHSAGTIRPNDLAAAVRDAMEYQKLREDARQKQLLESLMEGSTALLSGRNRQEVLERILQIVRNSGFDRARLYLLSNDERFLKGVAQSGMKDSRFIGGEWPVAEDYHFQQLLKDPRPRVFPREAGKPERSEERLDKEDVEEWASVPLRLRDRVIGHLSADNKPSRRKILERELAPLALFAAQAAAVIEKADLIEQAEQRARQLEALRLTTLAITSPDALERRTLLRTIIEQAVGLLRAKSGGLYEYHPDRGELEVIADHNRPDFVGNVLKAGDGVAGRLVKSGEPFRIIDDYNLHPDRSAIYGARRLFGAVLEVPLRRQERIVGVLYVDDDVGRKFTPEDARLLGLFADQSAIAIVNQDLITRDENRLRRLENLSRATTEIIGSLGKLSSQDLLTLIVNHAAGILSAEVCTIMLVKDDEVLSLEASFGHREGGFSYGKRFKIRSGFRTGLTGHIAYEGKLFNAHGEELVNHSAVHSPESIHTTSGKCYSLLAIPLKKQEDSQEKLIGLLRADNKKGEDGLPHPAFAFTKEDEWILSIFAETVVVCLESARLVEQLTLQRETKERLIDGLPHAVIANDPQGRIIEFNGQAERILRYTADEALNMCVLRLYENEQEPRRISRLLSESKDRKLVHYPTTLRDKFGQSVPIRLTASELKDEAGRRMSIVGYFEDMRLLKETERRLELLLRASDIVAQAQDLTSGLQSLAEMIVTLFSNTFCRILLFDDSDSYLTVEASAYFSSYSSKGLKWAPDIGRQFTVSDYEGLDRLLQKGKPVTLRHSDRRISANLEKFGSVLGLEQAIQSLLIVPLKLGDRSLGLLDLGEFCPESHSQFTAENIELVAAIAAQSTVLVDRMLTLLKRARLIEQVRKTNQAARAVAKITVLGDRRATLEAIVAEVKNAIDCDAVVLFEYDRNKRQLMPPTVIGVRDRKKMLGPGEEQDYPFVYQLLEMEKPRIVEHLAENPDFRDRRFAKDEKIESCVAAPLRVTGEKVGVIFINYRQRRRFTMDEIHTIQLFADQAAIAIHYAQFTEERAKKLREQGALVQLSSRLRSVENPREIMDSAVALTAGALGVDRCNLVMPDRNGDLILCAQVGWDERLTGNLRLEKDTGSQTGYTIMTRQPVVVADYASVREFDVPPVVLESGVVSGMSVPMFRDDQVVGALLVCTEQARRFSEEDITLLRLIADQTAVAIRGAERYEELNRKRKHLEAVHNASKAITTSFGHEKEVLDRIVREAVEGVTGVSGPKAVIGSIQLYDWERNELTFQNMYPPGAVSGLIRHIGTKWSLNEGKIGITGRTVRKKESQLVKDVSADPDYLKFNESTRSELSVPLEYEGRILGTINVESDQISGFDEEDQTALKALAEIAVIAIENARQYEELKRTHEELKETRARVEASTTLAWLGMTNNAWRHIIAGQAAEIRNRTTLIIELMKKGDFSRERVAEHLERIEALIKSILEKPLTPPLSSEQGMTVVNINDLVIERLNQLRQNEKYAAVRLKARPGPRQNLCVEASSEWLRRALDILVDNATSAVSDLAPEQRLVEVATDLKGDQVEIAVRDHGKGIPEPIKHQIFKKRIEQGQGMGMGLLIAQAIVETYGGRIHHAERPNFQGAEIIIRLPHKS